MSDQLPSDGFDAVDFSDLDAFTDQGISEARWARVRESVDVRDLLSDLFGAKRTSPIVCPFHGDTKPSFYIFPKKNNCFCYGCGDGEGFWDPIKIVDVNFGFGSRVKALEWLEKNYELPALKDGEGPGQIDLFIIEDGDDDQPLTWEAYLEPVKLDTLRSAYVLQASAHMATLTQDPTGLEVAREYLDILFTAMKQQSKMGLAEVISNTTLEQLVEAARARIRLESRTR